MAIVLRIFLVRSTGDERVVPHASRALLSFFVWRCARSQQALLANALPEPDLKYRSRLRAAASSLTAMQDREPRANAYA